MTPLLRLLLARLSPGGVRGRLSILIFHRVLPATDPIFPTEVDGRSFDSICTWVSEWFQVLPLGDAIRRLRQGQLPPRALAITFDDGYADNHDVALPILQRHGLPATFFVATGFLDGGRMFNDTVIESVRRCSLPQLDLSGTVAAGLGVLPLAGLPERRAAIGRIIGATKYLPLAERNEWVAAVAAASGARLPDDLMMRSEQVRALHRAGMTIGAHTVSHPILARLDAASARAEIAQGRSDLESIIGGRVGLFAYPNGKPGEDYVPETVDLVRELGFDAAVSTTWGSARPANDPFQLPRFTPWDRTRTRFGLRLARDLWSS